MRFIDSVYTDRVSIWYMLEAINFPENTNSFKHGNILWSNRSI